jgi:Serine aminopeptidase, S33
MLEFFLFVQHGWADDNQAMTSLAHRLATDNTNIIAPNLGYIQTWLRIAPLIQLVDKIAIAYINDYPNVPLKIIGHSMGGLIWLEVLNRHPEWWLRIHSLVLIASPVGGADLGRIIDPLSIGIGIAADLGANRKPMAEKIAAAIPTLVIAGDIDGGSDGTVTIACTRFSNAQFICLLGLSHPVLRNHPSVVSTIQEFWLDFAIGESITFNEIIQRIRAVPGITDGHQRDFHKSQIVMKLYDGSTIRTWKNLLGVDHIFFASPEGECLYAGFVGWMHTQDLWLTLEKLRKEYAVFDEFSC